MPALERIRAGLAKEQALAGTPEYAGWKKKAEPLFASLTQELVEETFGPCQAVQRSPKEQEWDRIGAAVYTANLVEYTRALCRLSMGGPKEKSKPKRRGRKKKK